MNPSNAYEQMRTAILDGRELESFVLSRAARKLNRCVQNWDRKDTPQFAEELQEALSFTQRLWTFLQVEVSNPAHVLPPSVLQSIFRLSRYVDRTVMKLYSGGTLQELKSLVDVNNQLAAGLASKGIAEPAILDKPLAQEPPNHSWG